MRLRRRTEAGPAGREDLLVAARRLFEERDYADVTFAEVAALAGTSEECVRAEFGSLPDLFAEVYQWVQAELGDKVAVRLTSDDPVELMRTGGFEFVALSSEPAARQLLLVNAPVALGWERWRQVGDTYGSMLVDATLSDAMDKGVIPEQPVRPLAYALVGMMETSAHWVALQPDRDEALAQVRYVLDELIDGLVRRT